MHGISMAMARPTIRLTEIHHPRPIPSPGTYQASLTVSNGVTPTTATRTIVITAPAGPVANFTLGLSSPTAPSTVTFTNTSSGGPTRWVWGFGDSSPHFDPCRPATKVYAAGTWTGTLTVNDARRAPVDHQQVVHGHCADPDVHRA